MSSFQISQIHYKAFAHPADEKALDALKKVPLLPELFKKVAELDIEEMFRAHHMYNSIQIGPRQFPSLWRMVHDVAARFGISNPEPTAYVSKGEEVNAFAFGMKKHSIVLTSELVDLMSDREIEAIIAHEFGHVLCQHMLYRKVGFALANRAAFPLTKFVPTVVVQHSIHGLFMAWSRAAEYSADRAALLVLQDPDAMVSCLGRLAGIPRRYLCEFDPRQFAEQVREYKEEATWWSKVVTFGMDAFLSHPEPAKRAAAILEWSESEDYKNILEGRYLTKVEAEGLDRVQIEGVKSCPLCRSPVGVRSQCLQCGLPQHSELQRLCGNGHVNATGWKFCKTCGIMLDQPKSSDS